jgi:hypothetical protein
MTDIKIPESRKKKNTAYAAICVFLLVLCQSCFKDLPDKIIVYQNDFEKGDTSNFKIYGDNGLVDSIKATYYNGSKVMGRLNREFVFFDMDVMPSHNALRIEFDLYIHDKWEGDNVAPGYTLPDFWTLYLNGLTLSLATFSNDADKKQSFPASYNNLPSTNPAHANAWETMQGACSYSSKADGTTRYKIDYTTAHDGPIHMIIADLLQGPSSPCIKSWSMDNLRVTAITMK